MVSDMAYIDRTLVQKCLDDLSSENLIGNENDTFISLAEAKDRIEELPTADVVPKSEVVKFFEKLKARECSNSVCAWCVHATDYGRRNEECDKPYIDKNGKEQKACYVYAKFESLIDNELAELKKKYTEENQNVNGN